MLPSLCIGRIKLQTPFLLAPMAGYSDTAFRSGVRELAGVGMAVSEMLNPRSVMCGGGRRREALLAVDDGDRPLGWQIYGSDPARMAECARYLRETRGAELIDINMGCPQRKITGRGDGAALLKNPALAFEIAAAVVAAVPAPVTVKIRIGWDAANKNAPLLAAGFAERGVSAITIHGRTAGQKYTGRADIEAIGEVVRASRGIPVIGNGDVAEPRDAAEMMERTGCAGVMIGRAALRNPWIFRQSMEYATGVEPVLEVTRRLRHDYLLAHLERVVRLYGSENAPKLFRKWIPQHAAALGIDRPRMVELLQLRETDQLRHEIASLSRN